MKIKYYFIFFIFPIAVFSQIQISEPDILWERIYNPDSLYLPQELKIFSYEDKIYLNYHSNYYKSEKRVFSILTTIIDKNGIILKDIAYKGDSGDRYRGFSLKNGSPKLFSSDGRNFPYGYPKVTYFNVDNNETISYIDTVNNKVKSSGDYAYVYNDSLIYLDYASHTDSLFIRHYDNKVNLLKRKSISIKGISEDAMLRNIYQPILNNSGNYYCVIPAKNRRFDYLTKISGSGNVMWSKPFTINGYDTTTIYNIFSLKNDNIMISGYSRQNESRLNTTVKMDGDGNIIWKNEVPIEKYFYKKAGASQKKYKFTTIIRNSFVLFNERLTVLSGRYEKKINAQTEEGTDTTKLSAYHNWLHFIDNKNGKSVKELAWEDSTHWLGIDGVSEAPNGNIYVAGAENLYEIYFAEIKLDTALSINKKNEINKTIKISPNPASDQIRVSVDREIFKNDLECSVISQNGTEAFSFKMQRPEMTIPVGKLSSGVYFLQIKGLYESSIAIKFVVRR